MLRKLDDFVEWISNWILVITGIGVCGLIFAGAFMRYVLKTDFYGSEELILLCAFWLYFFGSAMASKHDTQIKAEMLGLFVHNPKALWIANIITHAINLLMCCIASVWSFQYLKWNIDMHMKSNVFKFPTFYAVIPVVISFVLWTLYCVRDLVNDFRQRTDTES